MTLTPAPLTVTALPFSEHYVLVREYDRACLVRWIDGQPQSIVKSEVIGGGFAKTGTKRWLYAVPVYEVITRPVPLFTVTDVKG